MSLDHIATDLRHLAVSVDELVLDPQNARRHDDRNLAAIESSLRRFGQRQPLVVQRDGMVVRAGNGRLVVARRMGWTHVAAIIVDDAPALAAAFAIADNRSAEFGEWDWEQLGKTLDQLRHEMPDLVPDEIGFSQDEIDGLSFVAGWDATPPGDEHITGHGNTSRSGLTLKFSEGQAAKINAATRAAGLGDATAESVLTLVTR